MTPTKHTPTLYILPGEIMDNLKAVLCDPEGQVVISGSDLDRSIIQDCLVQLDSHIANYLDKLVEADKACNSHAEREAVIVKLVEACDAALRLNYKWMRNEHVSDAKRVHCGFQLEAALAAAKEKK